MMNRIDKKFRELRKKHEKAFIAFIMAGDPSLGVTEKLIFEMEKKGADIIELGVPFSDPLADGPTIQRSSQRALRNKVNLDRVFALVKKVRLKTQAPIVFLTYYNLIYHYGLEKFVNKSCSCGVDGVVIPDLPPEESRPLREITKRNSFAIIHLAAPTSSRARLKKIASVSRGFIYYVSITGTTGTRKKLPLEISKNLRIIKRMTKKPICVGFGISSPAQVAKISGVADGVIVGSAIIKIVEENISSKTLIKKVGRFIRKLNPKHKI